jgi:hypothetical protein
MSYRFGLFALLITFTLSATSAFAADGNVSIFDVRKTLQMDPSEPVYHDYYLNAGPEAGLKRGMFVSVVRRTPIHNPIENKSAGTLSVEVAKLQIISVESGISVGRLVTSFGSADRPVVDFEGIMIGDVLDLTTVSMEAPKSKRAAAIIPSAPATVTAGATENSSVNAETVTTPVPQPSQKTDNGAEATPIQKVETPSATTSAENEFQLAPTPDMVLANDEQPII